MPYRCDQHARIASLEAKIAVLEQQRDDAEAAAAMYRKRASEWPSTGSGLAVVAAFYVTLGIATASLIGLTWLLAELC